MAKSQDALAEHILTQMVAITEELKWYSQNHDELSAHQRRAYASYVKLLKESLLKLEESLVLLNQSSRSREMSFDAVMNKCVRVDTPSNSVRH
jgi:hypothetical protein